MMVITDSPKLKKVSAHKPRSEATTGSHVQYPFDPNLFEIELQNLRREKEIAEKKCEQQLNRCLILENNLNELTRVSVEMQRDANENADIRILRHQIEKQNQELEKMSVQLKAVNPSLKLHERPLVLIPPRVTVSIAESPVRLGENVVLLEGRDETIARLNETIAKMAEDFAFVHDHVSEIITQKEAVIRKLKSAVPETIQEVVVDTEGMEKLQHEMEEMRTVHEQEIRSKDEQIEQLQLLLDTLVPSKEDVQCRTCVLLQQKLTDVQMASEEEIQKLQARIAELETRPVRAVATAVSPSKKYNPDEFDELRKLATAKQNELKDCQKEDLRKQNGKCGRCRMLNNVIKQFF
jgi:hypothetical protein